MKQGTNIVDHLNVFNTLMCQFTSKGVKIKEEYKAVMLLCTLPKPWDHLITIVNYSARDSLEFDSVVGVLLYEEMQMKSNLETSTSEAFMTKGQSIERGEDSRGTSRSKSKGKKDRCWYYNKLGHLKKDCWEWKEFEDDLAKEENLIESNSCMIDEVLSICSTLNITKNGC